MSFLKTPSTFHKHELPLSPAPQDLEGDGRRCKSCSTDRYCSKHALPYQLALALGSWFVLLALGQGAWLLWESFGGRLLQWVGL